MQDLTLINFKHLSVNYEVDVGLQVLLDTCFLFEFTFCLTHVLLDSCFAELGFCWTRVLLNSCFVGLN